MKILTFDVEEWFLEFCRCGRTEKYGEYDKYLNAILEKLNEQSLKATFFCVGEMGRLFPDVVKKIHMDGHEIGCHSNIHTWLNKMVVKECREDTRKAVDSLEQCIGEKVKSYRAPAFSIGNSNKWAFEVLAECGIIRDASVFPAVRDFGGFVEFGYNRPTMVYSDNCQLKEFPICTTKIMGKEIAYSGGGYFRFFPLHYVKWQMSKSKYNMTYFHIRDLIPEKGGVMTRKEYEEYFKEPGTLKNRYLRFFKSNVGKKSAFDKMMKLIESEDFVNLERADSLIDWDKAPSVVYKNSPAILSERGSFKKP